MSTTSTVLLAAILIGVTGAAILRWRRAGQPIRIRISIAILLIALSLVLWFSVLDIRPAPRDEPLGVGVAPAIASERGNGFAVAVSIEVPDCSNPVRVTLVVAGTAEYWRKTFHSFPRRGEFHLLLPGADPDTTSVGLGASGADLQRPNRAEPHGSRRLTEVLAKPSDDGAIASGRILDWAQHLDPLVAQFDANWLEPRTLYQCYLRLPALTGPLSVLGAQQALGHAASDPGDLSLVRGDTIVRSRRTGQVALYDPSLETTVGTITVVIPSGQVLVGESVPAPEETIEGNATWRCETRPAVTSSLGAGPGASIVVTPKSRGGAYSRDYLRETISSDCGGIAAVSLSQAAIGRDIAILLIGGLLSLGTGLLLDALIESLTSRRRQRRKGTKD